MHAAVESLLSFLFDNKFQAEGRLTKAESSTFVTILQVLMPFQQTISETMTMNYR